MSNDRIAAEIATDLLRSAADAIDETIEHAFAEVARHRDVERVYYYRLNEAAGSFDLTHEWHSPQVGPMKAVPSFARLPLQILPPPFMAALRAGRPVPLPRTRGQLGSPVENVVAPDGDRAVVLVPALLAGGLLGVAGFSAACEEAWEPADIELLEIVAQGVARAVERRRVDEALRASESRFRAMCESSPLGIFLADEHGRCLYVNAAGERICGRSGEQMLGYGWMDALDPADRQGSVERWGPDLSPSDGREVILRFVHPPSAAHVTGQVRSVNVRSVRVGGPDGAGARFLGILEDVTERLRAEDERVELLARAEAARVEAEAARAEVEAIVSRIDDAFVALDREGRYRWLNDRAIAMIGRPREELIGHEPWVLFPSQHGAPFHRAFERALSDQQQQVLELPSADGKHQYEVRVYPSPTGVSIFAEDITERKRREEELASDREYLRQEVGGGLEASSDIIGFAGFGDGLREVIERVGQVASSNTSVLITGETGTGKELVARAIHERSPRRERLLVKVNCAAISAGLVESELFGHEKGAFTGALTRRKGRFELAHGGTLLLDEVGELPLDLQAKLLRVLQEREFERVGGTETVRVDVRVLAATNRNLREMVAQGKFREDLYYRLAVFPVALPPLRERPRDVAILVHAFLRRFARQAGKRISGVTPEAMRRLESYRWPGNVRELQNVVERAVILASSSMVGQNELPELPELSAAPAPEPEAAPAAPRPTMVRLPGTIDELERDHVARTLEETSWVIEGARGAAQRLGLHPNTLRSRLKKWGLKRPELSALAAG